MSPRVFSQTKSTSGGGGSTLLNRAFFQARLTTESGVPVSPSNRTSQGTIFLTPILSGIIRDWTGATWTQSVLTEISNTFTISAGQLKDIFYSNGALSFSAPWIDDTTRTDALSTQDGIPCLASDHTKLHVGTLLGSGANVIDDTVTNRGLGNVYNLISRQLQNSSTNAHPYASGTARSWGDDPTNQVQFVLPYAQLIKYSLYGDCTIDTTAGTSGSPAVYAIPDWTSGTGAIGDAVYAIVDNWSAPSVITSIRGLDGISTSTPLVAGRHYIRAVEIVFSANTQSFNQYRIDGQILN